MPPAKVEAFFDSLVPSRADELLAAGDELSLREAAELEPRRADIALALGRARLERGAEDEALEAVEGHEADFAADGLAARVRLTQAGDRRRGLRRPGPGRTRAALEGLLEADREADGETRERPPPRRRRHPQPKATRPTPPRASTAAAWPTALY